MYVNEPLTDIAKQDILNKIQGSDIVVVSMLIRISMDKGLSTIHSTHNELLQEIDKIGISAFLAKSKSVFPTKIGVEKICLLKEPIRVSPP